MEEVDAASVPSSKYQHNKCHYDKKVKGVELELGDLVLVRNMREKGGTGKLRSFWEEKIFKVIEKKKDLPVYKVMDLANKKDIRVLHRNLMMKCNDLSPDVFKDEIGVEKKKSSTPVIKKKEKFKTCISDDEADEIEIRFFDEDSVLFEGEGGEEEVSPRESISDEEDKIQEESTLPPENDKQNELEESEEDESFYGFEEEEEENQEGDGEQNDQEEKTGSESDEENKERRSSRKKCKSKMFTYSTIGGNPGYE